MQQGESVSAPAPASAPAPVPQYEKSEKYLSDYLKRIQNKSKSKSKNNDGGGSDAFKRVCMSPLSSV
jgi:hypothetical protein